MPRLQGPKFTDSGSQSAHKRAESSKSGNSTFTQYIDHMNPKLGTFEQFYYWSAKYWGGPGSPVVFMTPGESAAAGYESFLETSTITGHFAEVLSAAVVVMEHRYWGQSIPVPDLSTENMKYLTVNQSLADFEHFARTAKLPFDDKGTSNAANAPWVMSGGSYAGTLAFNMAAVKPGTFWAYTSSSGPAEAIYDFYGYYDPIREHMPKNCSTDLEKVIAHIDSVLINGTTGQQQKLLSDFGAETMAHLDDFAEVLTYPIALWQGNQFYGGYSNPFYEICDAVEGISYNSTLPSRNGIGLERAYKNFASYMKEKYFYDGVCGNGNGNDLSCYDTYNSSSYSDISLNNEYRQFQWLLCNEPYAAFQDGAPEGHPTIVSRLVNADYNLKACSLYFPESKSGIKPRISQGYNVSSVNSYFKGWDNFETERLLYVTGSADPFREQSVSSKERPGGPRRSTKQIPIFEIDGGYHGSDMILPNAEANENVGKVVDAETAQLVKWIKEWPGYSMNNSSSSAATSSQKITSTNSNGTKAIKPTPSSSFGLTTNTNSSLLSVGSKPTQFATSRGKRSSITSAAQSRTSSLSSHKSIKTFEALLATSSSISAKFTFTKNATAAATVNDCSSAVASASGSVGSNAYTDFSNASTPIASQSSPLVASIGTSIIPRISVIVGGMLTAILI